MDKDTRNAIERATQRARKLLEEDFADQLEGDFDIHLDGTLAAKAGSHLSARQAFQRERIVAAIEHKRAAGMNAPASVADYLRDAAFTTLNRFVALKMLEARELVQECITQGEQSRGYREFCGMAPGLPLLPDSAGYRLYIESLFDELSTEVKVLFDRRDPSSVLWPKRTTFEQLLEVLNAAELATVWGEDETIGWVYQFFNGQEERKKMREESQVPRNSRELAVRNQFFTPRYVVQFLTDNTLGRIWYEMRDTKTVLAAKCEYMVRKPGEEFAPRAKKDPREIRVLDPACGSGHFLLYAFDLLLAIYEEAWLDPDLGPALWREAEVNVEPLQDESTAALVDPELCRLSPGAQAKCFRCGAEMDPLEARFVIHHYGGDVFAGRPMIYCARCCQEMPLVVNMPLQELSLDRALRSGWFSHATATAFVELASVFEFSRTSARVQVFERLELAAAALPTFRRRIPALVLAHNLHGVDIDARCAQIAQLALWMRAQKAFRDFGIGRDDRAQIRRSNIVVAEPLVADEQIAKEFVAKLGDVELGRVFMSLAESFSVAGDLGLLLRVEQLVKMPARKQGELFAPPEERIRAAVDRFVREEGSAANTRRRLFADDANQAIGLLEVSELKFDALLMNPPFGAGSLRAKKDFDRAYPRTKNDVYAAFVERGIELLASKGRIGAITSRTGFYLSSFQKWREEVLLKQAPPAVVADLGYGVLDSAMVETAAYCLEALT